MVKKGFVSLLILISFTVFSYGITHIGGGGIRVINSEVNDWVQINYENHNPATGIILTETGFISQYLDAYAESRVRIESGAVNIELRGFNDSIIDVNGGHLGSIFASDQCNLLMLDGSTTNHLMAIENSVVTLGGGTIGTNLWTTGDAQVMIVGGRIKGDIYAGLFGGSFDRTRISLEGIGFTVNGMPVKSGESIRTYATGGTDPHGHACLTGTIRGRLLTGDIIDNTFYLFENSDITFTIKNVQPGEIFY